MKNSKKIADSATLAVWVLTIFGFFSIMGIDVAVDQEWLNSKDAKMLTVIVAVGLVAVVSLLALIRQIAEREECIQQFEKRQS